MLLVFGLVISFYFIVVIGDGITQNRLIQEYHNESYDQLGSLLDGTFTNITFNMNRRRLGVKSIPNFKGKYKRYLGVALLTDPNGNSFCTGAYIPTPAGARGKYVLTAAHCLFIKKKNIWNFWDITKIRVEFGITKEAPQKMPCHVSDFRVNDQYPNDNEIKTDDDMKKLIPNDYAIIKLKGSCIRAKHPYDIRLWQHGKKKERVGYRSTRTLRSVVLDSVTKKVNKGQTAGLRSGTKPGDSGGPMFGIIDKKIQGITSAIKTSYLAPVQITQPIKANINKYILEKDGISPLFKDCMNNPGEKECWSKCTKYIPSPCFKVGTKTRPFAEPKRKIPCNAQPEWTECGQPCPSGKKMVSWTAESCPSGQKKKKCIKRTSKYLCGKKQGGSAHFGLKNLMEMYYDDMDQENENDDLYYDDVESADYYDDDDADYYDDDDDADYYDDDNL